MTEENTSRLTIGQAVRAEALREARTVLAAANVFGKSGITDVQALITVADWILDGTENDATQTTTDKPSFGEFLDFLASRGQVVELPVPAGFTAEMVGELIDSILTTGKCPDPDCEACGTKPGPVGPDEQISWKADDDLPFDDDLTEEQVIENIEARMEAEDTEVIPAVEDEPENESANRTGPLPVGNWENVGASEEGFKTN